MVDRKLLNCIQKIANYSQIPTFEEIINKKLEDDTLVGLLIYGSFLEKKHPNDIDVLIVLNNGKRHFEMIMGSEIIIEIEYVSKESLFLPLTNFYWYTENWEYEIAKYVYGAVVYDPLHLIKNFIAKVSEYPIDIARYLFLHRIGRCSYISRKLKTSEYMNYGYIASLINMFVLACLAMERKIPKNLNSFCFLNEKHRRMVKQIYYSVESFDDFLYTIAKEAFETLKLNELLQRRSGTLKFWYPAEVEGLRLVTKEVNTYSPLPEVFCLEDL